MNPFTRLLQYASKNKDLVGNVAAGSALSAGFGSGALFAGLIAQSPQSGQRDGAQPVAARRRRQLGDAGPDRVPALLVLGQQPQIQQR